MMERMVSVRSNCTLSMRTKFALVVSCATESDCRRTAVESRLEGSCSSAVPHTRLKSQRIFFESAHS